MQLTNDTDRMLCLIYNEFLNRRKIGISKREAICFSHPSVLQTEFLQGIHEDDIVDALTELANKMDSFLETISKIRSLLP